MATYKIQIDDLVREATAEEITKIETQQAKAKTDAQAREARETARQAVLDKLGLTADEAAALLG